MDTKRIFLTIAPPPVLPPGVGDLRPTRATFELLAGSILAALHALREQHGKQYDLFPDSRALAREQAAILRWIELIETCPDRHAIALGSIRSGEMAWAIESCVDKLLGDGHFEGYFCESCGDAFDRLSVDESSLPLDRGQAHYKYYKCYSFHLIYLYNDYIENHWCS